MREKPKPFGRKGKFLKFHRVSKRCKYSQGEHNALLWPYRQIKRALIDIRICRLLRMKLTQTELDRFVMQPMNNQDDHFILDCLVPVWYDKGMVDRGSFWVGGSLDITGASPKPIKILPLP